jgi:putative phage-type endonuclease
VAVSHKTRLNEKSRSQEKKKTLTDILYAIIRKKSRGERKLILKPESREEWLRMRAEQGIGGSDAGTVLGLNPYCSNLQLWRQKVGLESKPELADNAAVQYGKTAEENIRALFALDYPHFFVDYHELWMYVNDDIPWQFATLDGEIEDDTGNGMRGILEIKTCTIQNNSQWAEWDDRIPNHYYAQILHQLSATGWDFAILRGYLRYQRGGEWRATIRDYRFERKDVQKDIEYLCEQEAAFMDCVRNRKQPGIKITI